MSTTVKVVIAILLVALVIAAGLGSLVVFSIGAVAADHTTTTRVLEKARADNNQISAQLKQSPDFSAFGLSGTSPDFAGFQKKVATIAAQFSASSAMITTDLGSLRAEDARIKSKENTPQAILGKSQYETDRKRVESVIDAFDAAGSILGILEHQFAYYDKLLNSLEAFQAMTAKAGSDVAGALSLYPSLEDATNAGVAGASDPSVSPQHKALSTGLKTLVADFKAILLAAQARDSSAAQAALAQLQSDEASFAKFDDVAFQAWETALIHPYQLRYQSGLTDAGFSLVA